MNNITDFIPRYQEVNVIFLRHLESFDFGFEEQKTITEFYNSYKDVKLFEKMMFEIILAKDNRKEKVLLGSIKQEIDRNISLFEEDEEHFDTVDMDCVNDDAAIKYLDEIEEQIKVTNECGARLLETAALWDSPFDLSGIDDEAWQQYDNLVEEHSKEIEILHELYRKRKELMDEVKQYEENMFRPIYELSKIFSTIIQKYIPSEDEQVIQSGESTKAYFDMGFISSLYGVCNSEQFENISELDFYNNLNLLPASERLKIRPKEKIRVCYLVFLLGEKLPKMQREEWRTAILENLGIDTSYYKSKYKEPVSDFPSDSNQEFAKEMKAIFK